MITCWSTGSRAGRTGKATSRGEIAEVGFFDPLNPPEGVSPGTRNRLGEMFGSRTRSNLW